MIVLGIDPGNQRSAYLLLNTETLEFISFNKLSNADLERLIPELEYDVMVIEMIASYGMAVGASIFETCVAIGRFEATHEMKNCHLPPAVHLKRAEVKRHLCHETVGINDAVISRRLKDIWGEPGTKRTPGKTFGITADVWSALAVATAYAGVEEIEKRMKGNEQ